MHAKHAGRRPLMRAEAKRTEEAPGEGHKRNEVTGRCGDGATAPTSPPTHSPH